MNKQTFKLIKENKLNALNSGYFGPIGYAVNQGSSTFLLNLCDFLRNLCFRAQFNIVNIRGKFCQTELTYFKIPVPVSLFLEVTVMILNI